MNTNEVRHGCDLTRRAALQLAAAASLPGHTQPRISTRILIVGGKGSRCLLDDVRQTVGNALRADVSSLHVIRIGEAILVQATTSDATVFYPLSRRDFAVDSCGCGDRPASTIEQNAHCFLTCGNLKGVCSRVGLLADRKPAAR